MLRRIHAVLGLTGIVFPVFAATDLTSQSAIEKLYRSGSVHCQPTLNRFCKNIHIGCSGRTKIPTFSFRLSATATTSELQFASREMVFARMYRDATTVKSLDGAYIIVRPRGTMGYIRLGDTGDYSFRYYASGGPVMSYGRCH